MAPLFVLLVVTVSARATGAAGVPALDDWTLTLRIGLAAMFLVTGIAHFAGKRAELIAIVPPRLPRPALLVTLTGVAELAGAVGLLLPPTARAAAICLAVLLLAMFPANLHAARTGKLLSPLSRLWPRTALQAVFLAACVGAAL